jgi:Cu/Ag efflux pump CusA
MLEPFIEQQSPNSPMMISVTSIGVATLVELVVLSAIRHEQTVGLSRLHAIRDGAMEKMRPILMACLAAAFGFLQMTDKCPSFYFRAY